MEERDPLTKEAGVDVTLRIEVLRKWRNRDRVGADRNVLERIERLSLAWRKDFKVKEENTSPVDTQIGLLIAAAYPDRVAKQLTKQGSRYKLSNSKIVSIPQHDALIRESWLAVAQLDAGHTEGKVFLAAPVHEDDLLHLTIEQEAVRWDSEREMVVGVVEKRIGNLVMASKPMTLIPEQKRHQVLFEVIRNEGLKVLGWGDDQLNWQARVLSVRKWRPQEEWPDVSEEHLLSTLEQWLPLYLTGCYKKSDFKKLDMPAIVDSLLPWNLVSKLNELAPGKIDVPSGSSISLAYYSDGRQPELAVRLQEVFGLLETPTVNEGRVKLVMHLLSPGYKPVQVTQDLKSFWSNAYTEVRKELRSRYPKHSWPDDPFTAQAVRGAKKRF
jgi:ATP-dependent helicase HrpB